jgi:glucose-6-phosphate dehydrogenase assembly protein OpcA
MQCSRATGTVGGTVDMSVAVQPEKILRELRELWDELGRAEETPGGVLRACAMTLLVAAEEQGEAEQVRKTLGVLMHDHPSRAIVLRSQEGSGVEARVFAECWMPFGRHQQICAEGIEITAGGAELSEVVHVLLPLMVPDLPVVLWCRGGRAFTDPAIEALFPLADKIIFDSAAASDANAALQLLRSLRARGRRVADLTWTRLTGWREVLSQLFDDGVLDPDAVASVRIVHGGSGASTCAMYLTKWIEQGLPGARVMVESASGEPGIRAITLLGGSAEVSIRRTGPSCVEARAGGRSYRTPLPPVTEEALMREELSILGPDSVFDRVLA